MIKKKQKEKREHKNSVRLKKMHKIHLLGKKEHEAIVQQHQLLREQQKNKI